MMRFARWAGLAAAFCGLVRAFSFMFPSSEAVAFYSLIGTGICGFLAAILAVIAGSREPRV